MSTNEQEGPLRALTRFTSDMLAVLKSLEEGRSGFAKWVDKWPREVPRTSHYIVTTGTGGSDARVLWYLYQEGVVGQFTLPGIGTVWYRRESAQ